MLTCRAFHRKDWPSFSLKKAEQQQRPVPKARPSTDHEESELSDDKKCAIICPKQKYVVVCQRGDLNCKKECVNSCLYVLYKVDAGQANDVVLTNSVSSV